MMMTLGLQMWRISSWSKRSRSSTFFLLQNFTETITSSDSDEPVPVITEVLPKDKESLLRHLERTNPEALALARDWDDVARTLVKTQEKITRLVFDNSISFCSGLIRSSGWKMNNLTPLLLECCTCTIVSHFISWFAYF